jgi:hypothetical protein
LGEQILQFFAFGADGNDTYFSAEEHLFHEIALLFKPPELLPPRAAA